MPMRARHPNPDAVNRPGDFRTLRTLLPYLWPVGESALRARVIAAVVFLVAAKGSG